MLKRLIPNKLIRRLTLVISVVLFIALLFFLLRGPYLSNSIKRAILPVLEDATGESIIIDSAVINLFPFYLQTKGFKVFDGDGNKLLHITKMRAYIDLTGLFSGKIRIRRLTVKEPELTADRQVLDDIIERIQQTTNDSESGRFGLSVRNVRLSDGKFTLNDTEENIKASGSGINMDMLIKKKVSVTVSLEHGTLKMPGLPELDAGLDAKIKIADKKIKVSEARIYASDSTFNAGGEIYADSGGGPGRGGFRGSAKIFVSTIGKIFGLKESGEGELSVSGSVNLVPPEDDSPVTGRPEIELDLRTSGWFYLETLMELLKVDENIRGRISIEEGRITGVYPDLTGEGSIEVEDAVLDTLSLDDIKGEMVYSEDRFELDGFVAHTYDGELRGSAFLFTDGGYSVDASVENVNSQEFFEFIAWDPPFTPGKISGDFSLSREPEQEIALVATAAYVNTSPNDEKLLEERLKSIQTDIGMKEGILTLSNSVLTTSLSRLYLDGDIDLIKDTLDLDATMRSDDAVDLTAPDFEGLRAPVTFTGRVKGPASLPEISGIVDIGPGIVNGERFDKAAAEIVYTPESLHAGSLDIIRDKALYEVSGSIAFRKSEGLFSFKDPYYRARAVIEHGDASSLITASYEKVPISGRVDGSMTFEGDSEDFSGSADVTVKDAVVYGQPVDRAVIKAELSPESINFSSVEVQRGMSGLRSSGSIYFDQRFKVSVTSSQVRLKDLAFAGEEYPVDARFNVDLNGSGTLADPEVRFSLDVLESHFRGVQVGTAGIKGDIRDKRLSAHADLLDGIATADAVLELSSTMPWEINMEFSKGRYDFLLAGLLKDVPRDISASLEGSVRLKGREKNLSMSSRFSSLTFSLYGYNFTNDKDIVLELSDNVFSIGSMSISGGSGNVSAAGSVNIGRSYDLKMDGRVNLAPLKAVFGSIETLRGQGVFSVSVSGPWDSPEFRGEINIRDGATVLAGFPYRIESANGDIFFDGDRITIDAFNAEFAGGSVTLSGAGYLDGLSIKNLSLSSVLKGIKLRPVEDVDVVFDGNLFFETSPKKQTLMGDIDIVKARHKKRIEWKSWLLKLRQAEEVSPEQISFLGKTELNIYVKGEDNIIIDNNIAKTPVKIDLNVQGNIAQYGLVGRVETNEGTIFFRGNEFEIIDASVDFVESGRIVPVFHIQAETFTKGYRVRLNLDGPSDKFTLSLFSDPPLSDVAILTLLTSGQIDKGSEGLESGIGAGEATAFLTGRLQDVIEERFKYITGFERFEVDPHTTSTGAVSSKVTVGKRLLGERLLVTYSSSVGSTELDVIKLQYKLTDNLSLVGSRDEIGDVGGDIKYRFEFK